MAGALVHINFASLASVAGWTVTCKCIDAVNTRAVVMARSAKALVDVDVAMIAGEARCAVTPVASHAVYADTVVAQLSDARV